MVKSSEGRTKEARGERHKEERRERKRNQRGKQQKKSWGRRRCRQPEKSRRRNCLIKAGEAPATRKVGGGPPQGRAYFAICGRRRRSRRGGAIFSRALFLGQFYGAIGSV